MKHSFRLALLFILLYLIPGCTRKGEIQLVKRGKTGYSIYIVPSASKSVRLAAEELKSYFVKVTGASPAIVASEQPPAPPFISLGNTAAAKTAGLDASGIPIDGFRIVTRDGNIFILGPDTPDGEVNKRGGINNGTSNGVYTFIEDYLGVKWLMPGKIGEEYNEIKTLSIPALNRNEYSPFDYRVISLREKGKLEDEWDRHLKLGEVSPIQHNHSWIETVPPSLFDKHPEWFAMKDGKRVPPIGSYYKLESTNQEMVKYFAGRVMDAFRKNPKLKWYSLSPSDGAGYSESPESLALTEKDPNGNRSVTPLIFTFYNDVARIVGKEFPDHMLGAYIYGDYHYPPKFKIEPNIAVMLPTGTVSGFKLYRQADRNWVKEVWVPEWSELSKKYGFDLYYYCFPISLMQHNGIITPPAPDILNSQFSDMIKYGFKGIYFYGNPIWPAFGPGNYAIAKLFWDPKQDAHQILHNYYQDAYGIKALPFIEKFHMVLDTAYSGFMGRHKNAKYLLTEDHLKEIYAPIYPELEKNYLEALSVKKKPRQQQRLELIGNILSLMQWNLRDLGYLAADFKTSLTLNNEQIDSLLANQNDDCRITRIIGYKPTKIKIDAMPSLADAKTRKASVVPVNAGLLALLHVPADGKVSILIEDFNKRAECNQYLLTDAQGKQMLTGIVSVGRTISFNGKAGSDYYFSIPSRNASARLKIDGAAAAYRIPARGLQLDGKFFKESLVLYFYVPKGIKSFHLTMGNRGAVAEVFSPDGRKAGQMNNTTGDASHILVSGNNAGEGFWKIEFKTIKGEAILALDEQLPQWFNADPAVPLRILPN